MKFLSKLLIMILISQTAYADCDFSTGIKPLPDGTFAYSKECHQKVGKMVQDLKDRSDQVDNLNKAIELKDLAIDTNEKRAQLWMDTSTKLEGKVNDIESSRAMSQWVFFSLGILTTVGAAFVVGQVKR